MGFFEGLSRAEILDTARVDFLAAAESRKSLEDRKLEALELYRRYRDDVQQGVKAGAGGGPFGWSKIDVPAVYWASETILARMGVQYPKPIVTASTPEAGPYAMAAQLRLDRHLSRAWAEERALLAMKQQIVLGDSPVKTPWDATLGGPVMQPIPWFDFFMSPEALFWDTAEVLWHRTWWTKRSLVELLRRDARRDEPLYDHEALERCINEVTDRSQQDTTWQTRRSIAGLTEAAAYGSNDQQIAFCEGWYIDGSRVLIAGNGNQPDYLLQVVEPEDSTFRDAFGVPFRPLSVLQNTPDPGFIPQGVSDAEVLGDFQAEISTLLNQAVDQATANINSPAVFDASRISAAQVQAMLNQPRGLGAVNGPVDGVIQRIPPGQLSGDHERLANQVLDLIQRTTGISDITTGQMDPSNQTATGMGIIASESNMRHKLRMKLAQLGFRRVAKHIYCLDRAMGSPVMGVPVPKGFTPDPGQEGISAYGGMAMVPQHPTYGPGMHYDVDVDAGAMAPPGQSEQAQKVRAFAMDASANPVLAQMTDWRAVGEMLAESHGLDSNRVFMQQPAGNATAAFPGGMPGEQMPPSEGAPVQGAPVEEVPA